MVSIKLLAVILVLVFSQLAAINVPRGYARIQQIPFAIVTPKIDGKYTPLDQVNFTDIGRQAVQQDPTLMPKDEWDDSTEAKMSLWNATDKGLSESFKPEWYVAFKHDDKWLYAMVDAVSDTHVGSVRGGHDTRQWVSFYFRKTANEDSGYFVDFYFLQEKTLQSGKAPWYSLDPSVPWYVLPSKYYNYKFSIAEDPSSLRTAGLRSANSSVPHIIIEFAFDLSPLTKYSNTTRIDVSGGDINLDILDIGAEFNLVSDQPVPEFQWSALVFPVSLLALTVLIRLAQARPAGRRDRD